MGRTPQFSDIVSTIQVSPDPFGGHGWRLESFVADEVLRCREGRVFEQAEDADLYALLHLREYPIASLIQIVVDLPEDRA